MSGSPASLEIFNAKEQRREGAKEEDDLSHSVIGAAIEVHRVLGGPGMLERVYESALCYELEARGFQVKRQVAVPVIYKGAKIDDPLFLDILINEKIIVEVKATEKDNPIFQSQLLTYLRMTKLKLGLLINFGKDTVKQGVCRVVNGI